MQYVLFICTDPDAEPYDPAEDRPAEWADEMDRRKVRLLGHRLRPVEDATVVRVRNGETLVTDGPFAETREWIAGFDLIEARDLDEAIEVASKHPMARFGRIEVRPTWPWGWELD